MLVDSFHSEERSLKDITVVVNLSAVDMSTVQFAKSHYNYGSLRLCQVNNSW